MAAMNPCISSFLHYTPAMLKHSRAAPPSSFPHKVKKINLKQKNERGEIPRSRHWPCLTCDSFGWSTQSPEWIPSSISPPALQHIWEPTQEQPRKGSFTQVSCGRLPDWQAKGGNDTPSPILCRINQAERQQFDHFKSPVEHFLIKGMLWGTLRLSVTSAWQFKKWPIFPLQWKHV